MMRSHLCTKFVIMLPVSLKKSEERPTQSRACLSGATRHESFYDGLAGVSGLSAWAFESWRQKVQPQKVQREIVKTQLQKIRLVRGLLAYP